MNQDIEWTQDTFSATIKVPIKRTVKSKIQITAYSAFIKVYHQERNYLRLIDCFDRIKHESLTWDYTDNYAHISFQKEVPRMWDSFESIGKSKLELRQMRKEAIEEKELADKKKMEELQNLKQDLSKQAYDQKYEMDKEMRNKVEAIKQQEKEQALNYILNENSSAQYPLPKKVEATKEEVTEIHTSSIDEKEKNDQSHALRTAPSLSEISPNKETAVATINNTSNKPQGPTQLLSKQEIETMKSRAKASPQDSSTGYQRPRTMEPVQLNFTQRVFPTLAMREQHLLQAPVAKSSKPNEKVEGMNYQALKERADSFVRNQDYQSAIIAYEESLKLKPDALRTLLNYVALNVKILNIKKADDLLEKFEQAYSALDEIAKAVKDNHSLYLNAMKKKVWIESIRGNYSQALSMLKDLRKEPGVEPDAFANDIKTLEARINSEVLKIEADAMIVKADYTEAIRKYEEALLIDSNNEKVLSNIAFAHSKLNDNEKSLEYIQKCLDQVFTASQQFDLKSQSTSKDSPLFKFLLKSLLRKSSFLESSGAIDEAEAVIRECRRFDETNQAAMDRMKQLRRKRNLIEFESTKKLYTDLIKSKNFTDALEMINKAEALLDFDLDIIELLKNSLNKVACYLQISRNNEVVTECIRGLKILNNLINNAIDKRKVEIREKHKSEIKEMHIRFLLRRSSALARMGQTFNAKKDLEDVLKIDENHAEAKRILDTFKLNFE